MILLLPRTVYSGGSVPSIYRAVTYVHTQRGDMWPWPMRVCPETSELAHVARWLLHHAQSNGKMKINNTATMVGGLKEDLDWPGNEYWGDSDSLHWFSYFSETDFIRIWESLPLVICHREIWKPVNQRHTCEIWSNFVKSEQWPSEKWLLWPEKWM